jgi:hypothetical protein
MIFFLFSTASFSEAACQVRQPREPDVAKNTCIHTLGVFSTTADDGGFIISFRSKILAYYWDEVLEVLKSKVAPSCINREV